jgi:acylphosphatase
LNNIQTGSPGIRACRIVVIGRVQGVFYRQSTRDKALELGLNGTVKNCDDGSVEVFAEGKPQQIELLIEWCRTGPPRARVDKLDIHESTLKNYAGFIITY